MITSSPPQEPAEPIHAESATTGSEPRRTETQGREQTSVPKVFAIGDPSWRPFVHFLTASVKDVHPTAPLVSGVWLSPARKVNAAKEIAYQQRRFLDFSKTFIDSQPWVTLLTCVKHRHVEECYELSAARFPEMADKKFWDDLTVDVQETRAAVEKLLDAKMIEDVKELCDHQKVADKIMMAPETVRKLRDLLAKIQSKKWWIRVAAVLFVSMILAGAGAAVTGIKELRNLVVDPSTDLRHLQDNLVGLAMWLGFGGAIALIYVMVVTARAGLYLALFMSDIAPLLRLAHVDPATCTENLDYVEQVINSVSKRYRYLQGKLLRPFLSPEAEL